VKITVTKLNECGYYEALYGVALNKNQSLANMPRVLERLAPMDKGHNKALESIVTWWSIILPRYMWSQFDTYRVGVSKSSESTMHTILKRPLTNDDFDLPLKQAHLDRLNQLIKCKEFVKLKNELPEGFLQERMVVINYKSLKNMIEQRQRHKLEHWRELIKLIKEQVEHTELLP